MDRVDYRYFSEELVKRLKEENLEDVCFFVYGSFSRNEHNPRFKSDIDGGFILDRGSITDKHKVGRVSKVISDCLDLHRVPTEFNLMDRNTNMDGRFMTYTPDYRLNLDREGRVLSGPDFLKEMNYMDYKSGVLYHLAFNLRGLRNGLLMFEENSRNDHSEMLENVSRAVEKTLKTPKKLLWLQNHEEIETNITTAREKLKDILPNVDYSALDYLYRIRERAANYDLSSKDEALFFHRLGLTSMENMIDEYIKKFPKLTNIETRDVCNLL